MDSLKTGHAALDDKEVNVCSRKEVAIISALLYRNGRHRTEKFYRVMRKVEKCCARWQQLGLVREVERLGHLMPRVVLEHKTLRLPSKQMFEYLVARLFGAYHLMLHLDGICREAAGLLLFKISTGHFFSTAATFLSNVARIRVLAVDFAGQVAKIYDDILPQMNHLKGSEAPPLLDTDSLPSSMSSLLQKHCSSLDVNRNSLSAIELSASSKLLDSLHICKEENITSTSKVDPFTNFLQGKNLISKESVNSDVKELSERVAMPVSSSFVDEDIGECVPMTKPCKKSVVAKKRKLAKEECADSNGSGGKGDQKSTSLAAMDPSLKSKKKKVKKNILKSDLVKTKQNKGMKSAHESHEDQCSAEFKTLFKAVKKKTKSMNTISNLRKFLEREKQNRQEKVSGRVSVLLKKEDWRQFSKFVRTRLKTIKGIRTLDSGEAVQPLLGKTRVRVKFWLLFPHLKGKKPGNWKTLLENIAT
ncbi:hypothetical protein GWK47_041201 [Chionoecetes opilio]|uniref:Nucleolus and neural progenitor protein-like N-terminal domain-containing protein n=1 Tax=Chionoecetes opilio TaxID=41210 RepID=A0A8J5CXB5_CHIOP|nr:hypothetical protein GWK47_041201 [Chionoecetes opilio]